MPACVAHWRMRVVLAAADHVEVELGAGRLQLAHALVARRAVVFDEHRQAPEPRLPAPGACARQVHALLAGTGCCQAAS